MNREQLVVGRQYLLRTDDKDGNEKPRSEWIRATWDGTHLRDADGATWTEWLTHYPEDIAEATAADVTAPANTAAQERSCATCDHDRGHGCQTEAGFACGPEHIMWEPRTAPANTAAAPVEIVEMRQPTVTVQYDMFGSAEIQLDDFPFITVRYDRRYTDNAALRALAERIAAHLRGEQPAAASGAAPQNERARFEAWWSTPPAEGYGEPAPLDDDALERLCWEAWQARAAQAAPQAPQVQRMAQLIGQLAMELAKHDMRNKTACGAVQYLAAIGFAREVPIEELDGPAPASEVQP